MNEREKQKRENINSVVNVWIFYCITYLKLLDLYLSCVPSKLVLHSSALYRVTAPHFSGNNALHPLSGNFLKRVHTLFSVSISYCLWISLSLWVPRHVLPLYHGDLCSIIF